MKKYNNKSNIINEVIKEAREKKNLSKSELSRKLELIGIYLDNTEIKRIEDNRQIVKDFELIALAKVLDIDLNELKKLLD